MKISTLTNPPTNAISKKLEQQHEKIRIDFVPTKITCFSVKKEHYSFYWAITISLVLVLLGGVIVGVYNWLFILSNIDANKVAKSSPSFDKVMSKQGKNLDIKTTSAAHANELDKSSPEKEVSPGTELFSDGTGNNNDNSSKLTFSTDLTTSDINYEQGSEPSERSTMDFTTFDVDSNGICEELEISTKENFSKTPHNLTRALGIYTLENYYRYNDRVVYYNNKTDVYLYYHTYNKFHKVRSTYKTHRIPEVGGVWIIGQFFDALDEQYVSLRAFARAFQKFVLVENILCADAEYPANGECEFGWAYSIAPANYVVDLTTYGMCRKPKPITINIPANSICTKFELSSSKEFRFSKIFGEYQLMNISYNDKVVYQKLGPINAHSVFMHSVTIDDRNAWIISHQIGDYKAFVHNKYCSDLDYPANGNCNAGWFVFSKKSQTWQYDSSMTLKCKSYHL